MVVCLIAMLLPLWSAPSQIVGGGEFLAARSSLPQAIGSQQPIFGPDDPTPEVRLHSTGRMKSDTKETESESLSSGNSAIGAADVSDSLAAILESEESTEPAESGSIFVTVWPYVLIVVALVAWGISRLYSKRPPSFKHHVIPERKQNEAGTKLKGEFKASKRFQLNDGNGEAEPDKQELELEQEIADGMPAIATEPESPNQDETPLKGQFKVATRFRKPSTAEAVSSYKEEAGAPTVVVNVGGSSGKAGADYQQAGVSGDRPADDEFEFDDESNPDDSASDSGVLSEEQRAKILEAAEILAAVGKRKNGEDGSRFK